MTNNNRIEQESSWRTSLGHFETCIETPIMSGELRNWLANAGELFDEVGRLLREEAQPTHAELLHKMKRQDPELFTRIEQLSEVEAQLQGDFDQLHLKLGQLTDRAEAVEPDELKLQKPLSEFLELGLAFVLAARKQDTAIATWYMEAFNRDVGVAD